jgi:hypothetical protein
MYRPTYFKIEELVSKEEFEQYYVEADYREKLFLLFDYRILVTADLLRKRYGRIVCNTWFFGGSNHYRGFRPWNNWVGAQLSQHKFGRALDLVPLECEAEDIRQDIIAHPDWEDFKYIKAIEDEVSWLHIDCRNVLPQQGLLRFGRDPLPFDDKGDSDESNR